jgi:hypothetical protein
VTDRLPHDDLARGCFVALLSGSCLQDVRRCSLLHSAGVEPVCWLAMLLRCVRGFKAVARSSAASMTCF